MSPKKIPPKKEKERFNFLFGLALVLGFALKLYIVYFGYLYYNYLVSPGSDAIAHYQLIQSLSTGIRSHLTNYPPLFHLLVLGLSKVFRVDSWQILTSWTPVLVILPAAAMYFLLRQLFSVKIAVLTTLIMLLASNYPLFAFVDGNYPDMLAYGLFSTLMFAFIVRYFGSGKVKDLIAAGFLFLAITLTHHFTFITIFGILFCFGLVQLFLYLRSNRGKPISKRAKIVLVIFTAAIMLIITVAGKLYGTFLFDFIRGLLTHNPGLHDAYLNSALPFSEYPQINGPVVWFLGIAGFIVLILSRAGNPKEAAAKQLVIIWLLFFYLVSRIVSSAVPARFARELALPLVVCLAYLLDYLFAAKDKIRIYKFALAVGLIGYLIFMNSAFFAGLDKLPEAFSWQVWFWPKDQQKLDYLQGHVPQDQSILYNPSANLFVPIRAKNKLVALTLSSDQIARADKDYSKILDEIKNQYKDIHYIFIDVKPPSNPSGITFSKYAQFELDNKILEDLGRDGQTIKKFDDGTKLIER